MSKDRHFQSQHPHQALDTWILLRRSRSGGNSEDHRSWLRAGDGLNPRRTHPKHAVPLREVDELAGLRMAEGQLSGCAERDADGAILVVRALGVERRRVVVERLPIGAVAVPIESRAVAAAGDGEVCSDPVQNLLVGLGAGRVLAQQVGASGQSKRRPPSHDVSTTAGGHPTPCV